MSKKENKITGRIGEDFACQYLEKNHYQIIERNFVSYQGEIDIIALEDNEIVFIEVKTRTQTLCGLPSESVNKSKKKQLYKVAEYFLYANNLLNAKVRFDVIEIYLRGSNSFQLNHIKDAIGESPFKI
ncbi:MAG: YraN family protein [Clostridia bacterium]|nr:YraN family protein [Clostridia bacterium]